MLALLVTGSEIDGEIMPTAKSGQAYGERGDQD
jgi:hypothetical protein